LFFAFAGVQVVLAGVVFGLFYHRSGGTAAALNAKFEILDSTPSPRVVLVGGSNVWYGIDSPMLEHELGQPAINMGICAPTTLEFQLAITESRLRKGDVVVISPEYHSWWLRYSDRPDNDLILQIIENTPEVVFDIDWDQMKTILDRLLLGRVGYMLRESVASALNRDGPSPERNFMNGRGDFIIHRRRPWPGGFPQRPLRRIPEEDRIRRTVGVVNRFHASCMDRGVQVFLSYPPLPEEYFAASADVIAFLRERIEPTVTVPFIDEPSMMTQPAERFYDSPYHPMFEGTLERTGVLARSLASALDVRLNPISMWNYRFGETILCSAADAEYFLLDGWGQQESDGCAAMGDVAVIQFDLDRSEDCELYLRWRGRQSPSPARVEVTLNGRLVGSLIAETTGWTESSLPVPAAILASTNRLAFTTPEGTRGDLDLKVAWFRLVPEGSGRGLDSGGEPDGG
jgi:hypothetical protein